MNYNHGIYFEWDEDKSESCFTSRGFDFTFAARVFFDANRIVVADTRRNYGEDRFQVTGKINERLFVVVYTPRHSSIRIISARKANHREVQHYEDSTHQD